MQTLWSGWGSDIRQHRRERSSQGFLRSRKPSLSRNKRPSRSPGRARASRKAASSGASGDVNARTWKRR
ncbi:hypothetical protein Y1Q_0023435 [Alligator mississippiensis]|uniref:Uncharacterized protein n=1 Tax=Alligator mississippiensis TaxID=8496 RepID=A0A151NPH0_ALLMI|nr:hypothetical protein Y1Q_0023435 [Alligator mississippiensis]